MEKKPRITKLHICCFEKYNENILKMNLEKYPERLCVIDDINNIVVDVETRHEYEYVKTVNMLYFLSDLEAKKISPGKRVACFEYSFLSFGNLSSDELKNCKEIIELMKKGHKFPDGNQKLTNEEYLELINTQKIEEQPKKMVKTRKKRK